MFGGKLLWLIVFFVLDRYGMVQLKLKYAWRCDKLEVISLKTEFNQITKNMSYLHD